MGILIRINVIASVALVWAAAGCGSADESVPARRSTAGGSTDGSSTSTTGASVGAGGSSACNALENTGPVVQTIHIVQAPPAPVGGAIEDGMYALTARNKFTTSDPGPNGHTDQRTIEISGGTWQEVHSHDGKPDVHESLAFTLSGSTFKFQGVCNYAIQYEDYYSVIDGALHRYEQISGQIEYDDVYTRQ